MGHFVHFEERKKSVRLHVLATISSPANAKRKMCELHKIDERKCGDAVLCAHDKWLIFMETHD